MAGTSTTTAPASKLNKKFVKEGVISLNVLYLQQAIVHNFNGLSHSCIDLREIEFRSSKILALSKRQFDEFFASLSAASTP